MLAATVRGTLGVAVQQILIDPEAKRQIGLKQQIQDRTT